MRGKIRKTLESKLAALSPSIATAYENVAFTPVNNVPYQRVSILYNTPRDRTLNLDMYEEKGFLSVYLCFPADVGPAQAEARADALLMHFKPPLMLVDFGLQIRIEQAMQTKEGRMDEGRYCIAVLIPWKAYIER